MERTERESNPQTSLGDRAVAVAGILAIVVVALFGAAPTEPPGPTRTAQSAPR
jgi:hypothetical protein